MLIDEFMNFEEENLLFAKKINDYDFWIYSRLEIYNYLRACIYPNKINSTKSNHKKIGIINLLKVAVRSTILSPTLIAKKKKILLFSGARRFKEDKYYINIFFEWIAEELVDDSIIIETPSIYAGGHYSPVKTKNIHYFDSIVTYKRILSPLLKVKYRWDIQEIDKEAVELAGKLENTFSTKISSEIISNLLKNSFFTYKLNKRLIRKLVKKISPDLIFELAVDDINVKILNEVARENGIDTIELQHGIIGTQHLGYNFNEKRQLDTFPQYLFTHSEYWNNAKFPIDNERIISTGYPYLEENLLKYRNSSDTNDGLKIIIISQPGNGSFLAEIAIDLTKELTKKNVMHKIIFKLHPSELLEDIPEVDNMQASPMITVISDNEHHVHYYLANSNVQIGVNSSTLFEGLAFGLKTFVKQEDEMLELMSDLINRELATPFANAKEIIEEGFYGNSNKNEENNIFFIKNSKEKTLSEMKKILKRVE